MGNHGSVFKTSTKTRLHTVMLHLLLFSFQVYYAVTTLSFSNVLTKGIEIVLIDFSREVAMKRGFMGKKGE